MGKPWGSSLLRELLRLFLQYMAVALCSLPATFIYFVALKVGVGNKFAMLASLSVGFGCAFFAWRALGQAILTGAALADLAGAKASNDGVMSNQTLSLTGCDIEPQHEKLKPLSDPDFRGVFVVTTYHVFVQLLRAVQKQNSERAGSFGRKSGLVRIGT